MVDVVGWSEVSLGAIPGTNINIKCIVNLSVNNYTVIIVHFKISSNHKTAIMYLELQYQLLLCLE